MIERPSAHGNDTGFCGGIQPATLALSIIMDTTEPIDLPRGAPLSRSEPVTVALRAMITRGHFAAGIHLQKHSRRKHGRVAGRRLHSCAKTVLHPLESNS